MADQDHDERPRATRNAGAFFSPTRGPTPVPIDLERYWDRLPTKRNYPRLARNLIVVLVVLATVFVLLWVLTPGAASVLLVPA